jgi:pimeloyl-ACP methyl ester carboxylesterase
MEWIDFSIYAALIVTFWFVFATWAPRFVLSMVANRNLDWLTANRDRAEVFCTERWLVGRGYFRLACYVWGTISLLVLLAVQVEALSGLILRLLQGSPKWEILEDVNSAMLIAGLVWFFGCLGLAWRRVQQEVPLAQHRRASLVPRSVGESVPAWLRAGIYTLMAVHLGAWVFVGVFELYTAPGFWLRILAPLMFSGMMLVIAHMMVNARPAQFSGPLDRRLGVRFVFAALVYVQVRFAIQLYSEIAGASFAIDRAMHLSVVIWVLIMMLLVALDASRAAKQSVVAFSILLVMLIAPSSASAQNRIVGVWNGAIAVPGAELGVSVILEQKDNGSWTGTIDIPLQNAKAVPLTNIVIEGGSVSFSITGAGGNPTFKGQLSEDTNTISGDFTQGAGRLDFKLTRSQAGQAAGLNRPQEPKPPLSYDAMDVFFENAKAGIKLAGTLTLPRSPGPVPAVVLITGSGPQDRDESIAGHRPFLVLADYLTRRGVAVLRVDDRGVGGSAGNTLNSTSEDFATDVLAAVDYLKKRREINAKRIGLIGHSEGGLVAPLAATKSSDVAFIVLMAGPGLRGDQILFLQAAALMKASGVSPDLIAQNREIQEELINIVKSEKDPAARDSKLRAVRDKAFSATPDNAKQVTAQQMAAQFQMVSTPWFLHFVGYDPRTALRQVNIPVLAMIGENDLQVPYRENLDEIEAALKAGGNSDYTIAHLPGLNHLFQTSKTGLPSEYAQIEETMSPNALEMIGNWIEKRAH